MLGALADGQVGRRDLPRIAARTLACGPPLVRETAPRVSIDFTCRHERDREWVGLYAARHIDALLERLGTAFGFTLTRGAPTPTRSD